VQEEKPGGSNGMAFGWTGGTQRRRIAADGTAIIRPSGSMGMQNVKIMMAIYESATTGRAVNIA
jgi:hypothetical protein